MAGTLEYHLNLTVFHTWVNRSVSIFALLILIIVRTDELIIRNGTLNAGFGFVFHVLDLSLIIIGSDLVNNFPYNQYNNKNDKSANAIPQKSIIFSVIIIFTMFFV